MCLVAVMNATHWLVLPVYAHVSVILRINLTPSPTVESWSRLKRHPFHEFFLCSKMNSNYEIKESLRNHQEEIRGLLGMEPIDDNLTIHLLRDGSTGVSRLQLRLGRLLLQAILGMFHDGPSINGDERGLLMGI